MPGPAAAYDLGEPKRVMASLHMAGAKPRWAEAGVPQFA